jgi:hypothetical protein
MGVLICKYCEQHEEAICNYMIREYHSQDVGQEKMTASVDAAFKNGYSLKLNTHLHQFMVDYHIVWVLKEEMGFKSWSDMSELELGFCFGNHTSKRVFLIGTLKKKNIVCQSEFTCHTLDFFSNFEKIPILIFYWCLF